MFLLLYIEDSNRCHFQFFCKLTNKRGHHTTPRVKITVLTTHMVKQLGTNCLHLPAMSCIYMHNVINSIVLKHLQMQMDEVI